MRIVTTTLILVAVYATLVTQETVACLGSVPIVSREQWGARAPNGTIEDLAERPAPYVIIHHSATDGCETPDVCRSRMRAFQNYHMDTKGWFDIGYNFVVGEDGNIYEGRGWGKRGAHSKPFNNRSIGICIIGDFTDRVPNATAVEAVHRLIRCAVNDDEIKVNYSLLAHRQTAQTTCPGDRLYMMMRAWPHNSIYY